MAIMTGTPTHLPMAYHSGAAQLVACCRYAVTHTAAAAMMMLCLMVGHAAAEQAVNPADTTATRQVIEDQLNAFRSGDHDRAYSHAAPSIKRFFPTVDQFIAMVRNGYEPVYAPGEYRFGRNVFLYGEVYQEVIVTDETGRQWQAVYTLKQQEDGSWKITGVKLNPHKGAAV